jgi:hypothetical protein
VAGFGKGSKAELYEAHREFEFWLRHDSGCSPEAGSAPAHRARCGQESDMQLIVIDELGYVPLAKVTAFQGWARLNVWSAALPQAKSEYGRLVCANVFGLCWRISSGP